MTSREFVNAIAVCKQPLFGERATLPEAMSFAQELIEGINKEDRAFAYTALYVVWNTFAKLASECHEETCGDKCACKERI